ncbi:amino acid ABC transporter substrate-binding protein [Actinomadura logoneensis]|uniref:Amino acid ABC transporter substrate-binding protein n=1 Tax=Actinomadura logoneensis TaxID=2293572 RepID=A0A372JDB3_9ACTN|nr:ABC transporter substrate-binding protein [Actinomadura logoneensis]RFU37909.1 amino acid ABC transporter substrate-binding protein [Actinomadura logoneensis]
MARRPLLTALAGLAALAVATTACAPQKEDTTSADKSPASAASCAKDKLKLTKPGQLTVATDKPAFEPWFKNDDPTNGQGYESAVAYAVAAKLGFAKNEVTWVTESFDSSYAPGPKKFDFDANQISVTPAREKAVTFSDGYYDVQQGVVTMKNGKYAGVTSVAELKDAKIAVQVGTTALAAVRDQIKPSSRPKVFNDQIDAVNALKNKQVDAIVLDLPTAFYVTAAQVQGSKIAGQLPQSAGGTEHFGLLLQQGNPLVGCLNRAIGELKSSGELARLQQQWLTAAAGAPVLK